jgi:hypothetical protein
MLDLTQDQLDRLAELEQHQYVAEVRRQVIISNPEMASDDGLLDRLEAAYAYCKGIGFTHGPAITQFLFYEAFAPGFYRAPAVDAWLRRPDPEQRFSDLLAVARSKMEEL